MKVLFDHHFPFLLAHGGFQILIEQLKEALIAEGVEVEYLRWWDDRQTGDLIHYFGRPSPGHIEYAHKKGIRYVMMELMSGQGSRPKWRLQLQGALIQILRNSIPKVYQAALGWESYDLADAVLASTSWEAEIMRMLFGVDPGKVHVLPNGVDHHFFMTEGEAANRTSRIGQGKWLVSLATITERKRVVEMCEAALAAQTPLWVVGKAYADDEYTRRFMKLVQDSEGIIRFEGAITEPCDLAPILKNARGFVLLSSMETQSIAASAAAAAGCPLLLSDLPWARSSFGDTAMYCPVVGKEQTAARLAEFYYSAMQSQLPSKQRTWNEVSLQLMKIYSNIILNPPHLMN